MQSGIERDKCHLSPRVLVRKSVEILEDRARSGGDHAGLHRLVAHVDEEDIDGRLRGPDHVLHGSGVLDGAVVELRTCPAVPTLIPDLELALPH